MAKLSISKAAKKWGISRTSVQAAIKQGKLTAVQESATLKSIDTSDMLRVFGEPKNMTSAANNQVELVNEVQVGAQVELAKKDLKIEFLERENELLRDQVKIYQEQLKRAQDMIPLMITHQPKSLWQRIKGKD
jgi:hypothetical protein